MCVSSVYMEDPEEDERRVCLSCGEELAHSAYYRHLYDKVGSICPGIKQVQSPTIEHSSLPDDLDSTFDLRSENEEADSEYFHNDMNDNPLSEDSDSDIDFDTDPRR